MLSSSSMFFTTERTFLSDGIYIILERRLHHNHHEKKSFSSQLHKENNFATVVFPDPWSSIKRANLLKSIKPSSESKSSPYKNIPLTVAQHFPARRRTLSCTYKNILLTVAQHFPARRRTLSCMYKNILLTVAQDFIAQYRLFCKHTTHKNTIELFSNIETCFTIFLPFVVHSLIIIFYKGLNFVYFPVI